MQAAAIFLCHLPSWYFFPDPLLFYTFWTSFSLSLSQGIDSDDDDDEAKEEEGGDQNCEEEEYQLELAHGYVKKGEKPKWEKKGFTDQDMS